MVVDSGKWFRMAMSADEVKQRSIRGVRVTFLRRIVVRLINFGSTFVLARLLAPADFGLIAMTGIATGLAGLLADMALSKATLRYRALTHAQASNIFWLKLVLALIMTLAVMSLAPLISAFYGDDRAQAVTIAMSLGILLGSIGSLHGTLLNRSMHFAKLARIEILTVASSVSATLLGATNGLGYWSLIWGSLAGSVVSATLMWQHCEWRPAAPRRDAGTTAVFKLAARMVGLQLIGFVSGNLSRLVIARSAGAAAIGQLDRASSFQGLMLSVAAEPLNAVTTPAMVRLSANPEQLCNFYYKVAALSIMAGLPVAFAGLALPHELIGFFFGSQWTESAELLRLLSIGILPNLVCTTAGWVNASISNPKVLVWWGFIGWGSILVGTVIGAQFGTRGLALGYSLTISLTMIPCMLFAFYQTPLKVSELARVLAKPVSAATAAGLAVWQLLQHVPATGNFARLVIGLGSFMSIYALLLITVFGQRRLIVDTLSQLWPQRAAAIVVPQSEGGA